MVKQTSKQDETANHLKLWNSRKSRRRCKSKSKQTSRNGIRTCQADDIVDEITDEITDERKIPRSGQAIFG